MRAIRHGAICWFIPEVTASLGCPVISLLDQRTLERTSHYPQQGRGFALGTESRQPSFSVVVVISTGFTGFYVHFVFKQRSLLLGTGDFVVPQ